MPNIAAAKNLVWSLWDPLTGGTRASWLPTTEGFEPDVEFWGPAPIGALSGLDELFGNVYEPLARAFPRAERRPYLFLGGIFEGEIWVATSGDILGSMDQDWLGIPRPSRPVRLRFGEFYRVRDGKVAEIRCLYDIPGLAAQSGIRLLPPFEGREGPPPGPAKNDGISLSPQDTAETSATLDLVEAMIGGCNRLDERGLTSMGMDLFWHRNMVWHGPWGIGSCHGFREFEDFAQGPSVASFPDRRGGHHRARIADGVTAAFTGWPSLRGTFSGAPFRGLAPTGQPIGMNLMDFYVRRGSKLLENWVLIDLIDFWAQCGVDLMAKLPGERG